MEQCATFAQLGEDISSAVELAGPRREKQTGIAKQWIPDDYQAESVWGRKCMEYTMVMGRGRMVSLHKVRSIRIHPMTLI